MSSEDSRIAIVGGGPSGLVIAIALARRGIGTTVFERDQHPDVAPRFSPDRSYTIDISGHGLKAIRHIDAAASFDRRMIPFKGLKLPDGSSSEWTLPGWTGSRGDILRSLIEPIAARHADLVRFRFEARIERADVRAGALTYTSASGETVTETYDLMIGADGAGSVVRESICEQVPGFTVERGSYPNYCTMIELDRVGGGMDKHYLYGLATRPFCVAGAIRGDAGGDSVRWFCAVGTRQEQRFSSTDEARAYLRRRVPRVLDFTSDEKLAAYAKRPCYHIGRTLRCSQLYGAKAVLLGDASASFPPIGQGVNAAMESAMTLDQCIGEAGTSPEGLAEAARRYSARWKPEADAVAWMAVKSLFENRLHMLRAAITAKLGISIFEDAKSAEIPWSAVRSKALRRWPLWA